MPDTVKKIANRLGLNLKFYLYTEAGTPATSESVTIDFANEVSIDLSSELTWATGGQKHKNLIAFKDPSEGTLKISTQIVTMQMLQLASGNAVDATATGTVSFKDDETAYMPKYYKVVGETLWVDETGTSQTETITVYKATVKPNYNVTYNGSGDPLSLDVEFDFVADKDGKVLDIGRAASAAVGG